MKKIDIIIFAGQSNMQGESESLSNVQVVEEALEYRWLEDMMIPLKNPVGENIRYDGRRDKNALSDLVQMGYREKMECCRSL